jgi:hypothetical protein
MADFPSELIFNRRWWWDPIDMEVLKTLKPDIQHQLVAISLETQAQMSKIQAAGMEKMSGLLKGGKQ